MDGKKFLVGVMCLFLLFGVFATSTVEAGPFGLFGGGCSSGSCGYSSNYNSNAAVYTEPVVEPELASIAPHGVQWQVAEQRTARKQELIAKSGVQQEAKPRVSAPASTLILAYRAGRIDPAKTGQRIALIRR